MSARFHGRDRVEHARLVEPAPDTGFGEWWAAIAVLALAALGVVTLAGSTRSTEGPDVPLETARPTLTTQRANPTTGDPRPAILASIGPAERDLAAVEDGLAELCRDPVLLALELEPDCETGVMTLSDRHFDGFGSAKLGPEARQDVRAAVRIFLSRLRSMPALWDSLEAIEIRGHSDPTATRSPYTTNLVGSQQRPLGVLFFLMSPDGLTGEDRSDLERLAVVSGASFSRPPDSCPEATRECFPEWRRVEIRPVLSEPLRRGDWSRTLEEVRTAAAPARQEAETQDR